jgi:hypothetical protein
VRDEHHEVRSVLAIYLISIELIGRGVKLFGSGGAGRQEGFPRSSHDGENAEHAGRAVCWPRPIAVSRDSRSKWRKQRGATCLLPPRLSMHSLCENHPWWRAHAQSQQLRINFKLQRAREMQIARTRMRRSRDLFFMAALILLQKSSFSLNNSHAFNRANRVHTQRWQHDAVKRWNFCKNASRISLHLLRLHIAFIFVLCPSVSPAGYATVGH